MEDREWLKTTAPEAGLAPAEAEEGAGDGRPRLQGRGLGQALRRQGDRRGRAPAARRRRGRPEAPPKRERKAGGGAGASSESLPSPLQGTVFKVAVEQGAEVAEGDLICVIEAMKMENEITAHRSGKVDRAERRGGRRGLQRRRPRRHQVAARTPARRLGAGSRLVAGGVSRCSSRCAVPVSSWRSCAFFFRFPRLRDAGASSLRVSGIFGAGSWQARPTQSSSRQQFAVEEVADREEVGDR